MNEKKKLKQSEARVLVYLSVVHNTRKHVTAIAHRLEIDYSYTMRILQAMVSKGWLKKHQYRRHMFYDLTDTAPVEEAKNIYTKLAEQLALTDIQEEIPQTITVIKDDKEQITTQAEQIL